MNEQRGITAVENVQIANFNLPVNPYVPIKYIYIFIFRVVFVYI